MIAAGRKATRMPRTKRRALGSFGSARAMPSSRRKYTARIARIAPSWISTSKVLLGEWKPMKWPDQELVARWTRPG